MEEKLTEYMIKLGEIRALHCVLGYAIEYCCEHDKNTHPLIVLQEIVDEKIKKLHTAMDLECMEMA